MTSRELDQLYADLSEIEIREAALNAEVVTLDVEYISSAQAARLDAAIDELDTLDEHADQVRRDIEYIEEGSGLRDYLSDCAEYRSAVR